MVSLQKINDQQQPTTYELKARVNNDIEYIPISPISDPFHQGLISLYAPEQKIKPKIAICVTMYNENRRELESTLNSIIENLPQLKQDCQVDNLEVVVVVMYDGISKICTNTDSNTIDPDEDILAYFKALDRKIENDSPYQMEQIYSYYLKMMKYSQLSCERSSDLQMVCKDPEHRERMEQLDNTDKLRFLREIKQKASNFIADRKNKAMQFMFNIFSIIRNDLLCYFNKKARLLLSLICFTVSWLFVSMYQVQSYKQFVEREGQQFSNQLKEIIKNSSISVFHCVKFNNGGKLSSHLWFFSGFCELFQPKYTILLDCGLVLDRSALANMYLAFETDENIGGVCGFMGIKLQDVYTDGGLRKDEYKNAKEHAGFLADMFQEVFSVQKAQMYEYNMGHFVDKPFESLFGYIQVLPGAFSGYRWEALKRDDTNQSILDDYLASVLDQKKELTLEQLNMHLAEDRILCLKIFSKPGKKYYLKYLPNCKSKVDPVTDLMTLISQRRRWINGSTFALKICLQDSEQVYQSNHTHMDLAKFKISMAFAWFNGLLSYTSLSVFFLIVMIMMQTSVGGLTLEDSISSGSIFQLFLSTVFLICYFLCLLTIFYLSITLDTKQVSFISAIYPISVFLGGIMIAAYCIMMYYVIVITIFVLNYYILNNSSTGFASDAVLGSWEDGPLKETFCFLVIIGFFINFLPYLFNYNRIIEMFKSFLHFIAYQAQFIHLFVIYAYTRIDDFSWGTKGTDSQLSQLDSSTTYKFKFVVEFLMTNFTIAFVLEILLTSDIIQYSNLKPIILTSLSTIFVLQLAFRVLGAMIYQIHYFLIFKKKMNRTKYNLASNINGEAIQDIYQIKTEIFNQAEIEKDINQIVEQNIVLNGV